MHSQPRLNAASIPPLVVDLDGCLIQTDLLLESSILLLKKSPIATFYLPFWLFRGKLILSGVLLSGSSSKRSFYHTIRLSLSISVNSIKPVGFWFLLLLQMKGSPSKWRSTWQCLM